MRRAQYPALSTPPPRADAVVSHCPDQRCVIDGVFVPIADTDEEEGLIFHAACGLDAAAIADVQAVVRQR
ncbi:MAG: hypothetical protein EXR27_09585 [Betaproteobacteria bacterium]|nr:hypothetical protein [Betaproteobacteria bacterium]